MNEDQLRELYNSFNQSQKEEIARDLKKFIKSLREYFT